MQGVNTGTKKAQEALKGGEGSGIYFPINAVQVDIYILYMLQKWLCFHGHSLHMSAHADADRRSARLQRWDWGPKVFESGIYLGHIASLKFSGPFAMNKVTDLLSHDLPLDINVHHCTSTCIVHVFPCADIMLACNAILLSQDLQSIS